MKKTKFHLEHNRDSCIESINKKWGVAALGSICSNICYFQFNGQRHQILQETDLLDQAFKLTNKSEINIRISDHLKYAQRLCYETNLIAEEADLLYTLIGNILTYANGLKEISVDIQISETILNWIEEDILTRDDCSESENRMSKSNPLYIYINPLLSEYKRYSMN